MFRKREVQLSSSGCFYQNCEGDEPQWIARLRVRLILSKCYTPDWPLWFGAPPWNPRFLGQIDLAWTVFLLSHDELFTLPWRTDPLHFAQIIITSAILWPSLNLKCIFSRVWVPCTFICEALKSHTTWSDTQRETMHNVATHQLTRYYQPQPVHTMV